MRRKIPSTQALIAFEAAARLESFTQAAAELALTQSAICRQIAGLEEFLGLALFRRTRHGVRLTEAGLAYSRKVAAQLDAVERDALATMNLAGQAQIELAVVPTFGTEWLLPRLPDFYRQAPQVTVHLSSRTRPFLFADSDFDAAIYYGDGDWPGAQAHFLMAENSQPVCSPALLQGRKLLTAEDLLSLPLLQQSTRPYAWRQWFNAQGLSHPEDLKGPRLELFSMLAQAASLGLGVALIPPLLIESELAQGRLVCPVTSASQPGAQGKGYYLMLAQRRVESAALQLFRDWLIKAADQDSSKA